MAQGDAGKRFEGYQIYDRHYEKVGKVDDLFVDENDQPEYIGVKTGLFGGPSTLIPMDLVRVNDIRQLVEVASDKATIEGAPSFGDDAEITAAFEERVYAHFGATREPPPPERGGYGAYHGEDADVDLEYGERSRAPEYGSTTPATPAGYEYPAGNSEVAGPWSTIGEERGNTEAESQADARVYDWEIGTERREADAGHSGAGAVGPGMSIGDTETDEFREYDRDQEGLSQPGSDLEDEDELRVQRSEEELLAGTRERVAGSVKVRKRVRTDRERLEVPTRREEVSVERVPASGEASEAQIGAEEVSVPVVEDEVVVQKKPVAKEEIRVRKDVVHERQIVEEDVRREEVEIEDDTRHRRG
jgi:uncharacterized protein (TIGR02271 family)